MKRSIILIFVLALFSFKGYSQDEQSGDWSLEKCINYAMEHNLLMESGRLSIQSNKINLLQARAGRLPNANLNGSYGNSWGRTINPTSNDFVTKKIQSSSWGLNSSVVLFNWFNVTNRIKQADVNLEASKYDMEKTKNDVILNVVSFYVNVIFNQELLENAKLQLNSIGQQLERTQKEVDVGTLPLTNLLDIQAQKATNELNVVTAQNNLELAILQLKQVMQMPAEESLSIVIPEVDVDENPVIDKSAHEVYQDALKTLPEIKSAELGVQSANLGLKVSRSALYPTLRISAGMSTNYSDLATKRFIPDGTVSTIDLNNDNIPDVSPLPSGIAINSLDPVYDILYKPNGTYEDFGYFTQLKENRGSFASVGLSIPIFNGLSSRSAVQRAMLNQKQAEINAQQVKNTLRQTIERAYNDVAAAAKAYTQSKQQVESLEESFRATEQRYNLHTINFVDYQISSNNLFIARSNLLRAKYDYIFKQKILDFYLGKPLTFN